MKVLVTGGSGFIGHGIANKLVADDHAVAITYARAENDPRGQIKFGTSLRDIPPTALGYNDVLFHQAANNDTQKSGEDVMFEANVLAPSVLFERFADAGCRQFVYASSSAVYGNSPAPFSEDSPVSPLTAYARSKAAFDEWAMDFAASRKVNVIGLRYCNVYGPGEEHKKNRMSMIRQIISQVSSGENPKLFWDGSQMRDWCYLDDVVAANMLAMNFQGSGIFNIGSGISLTFHEVLDVINKQFSSSLIPRYISNKIIDTYQSHVECCIDKAIRVLGYKPDYDLTRGVSRYCNFWN